MSEEREHPWWAYIDWPGAIAFTLSLGIATSMVLAVGGEIFRKDIFGQEGATLLSTIFGAAVGAVATYLGQSRQRQIETQRRNGEIK